MRYPEVLLPRRAYPILENKDIRDNALVRETHILSFSHKPTIVNYWHFELWVKDSAGNRIPRDKSSAHTRYLAKSILEYIMAEAVLLKSSVNIFRRSDFR